MWKDIDSDTYEESQFLSEFTAVFTFHLGSKLRLCYFIPSVLPTLAEIYKRNYYSFLYQAFSPIAINTNICLTT